MHSYGYRGDYFDVSRGNRRVILDFRYLYVTVYGYDITLDAHVMKIIIDLPEKILNAVRSHVDRGRFRDTNSFVRTAVENQLVWENGDDLFDEEMARSASRPVRRGQNRAAEPRHVGLPDAIQKRDLVPGTFDPESEIPVLDPGEMLWGQVNRFLPMKAGVRVLVSCLGEANAASVSLDDFRQIAGETAVRLGEYLREMDHEARRKRDEALATGFPTRKASPEATERSVNRYLNQFLAYVRPSDQELDGALGRLGLVRVAVEPDSESLKVGLTNAGLQFADLPNPVFDREHPTVTLSELERNFVLAQIRSVLPGESAAMRQLLKLMRDGTDDRVGLNSRLADVWPSSWSEKHVNTQRSGLTARLSNLGLVDTDKIGLEVRYRLTARGEEFLRATSEAGGQSD